MTALSPRRFSVLKLKNCKLKMNRKPADSGLTVDNRTAVSVLFEEKYVKNDINNTFFLRLFIGKSLGVKRITAYY